MTRIVIAHRLSTIVNANRIAVIENGKLMQIGTLSEIKEGNKYLSKMISREVL